MKRLGAYAVEVYVKGAYHTTRWWKRLKEARRYAKRMAACAGTEARVTDEYGMYLEVYGRA